MKKVFAIRKTEARHTDTPGTRLTKHRQSQIRMKLVGKVLTISQAVTERVKNISSQITTTTKQNKIRGKNEHS